MLLFDNFFAWSQQVTENNEAPWKAVLDYEMHQRERTEAEIWEKLEQAYAVMKDAVETGLERDMISVSGMISNGAKKVKECKVQVLGPEFHMLVYNTLSAKELNACMGRVVAAPTAGASGIMPGVLTTLEAVHKPEKRTLHEAMLIAAGVALIIENRASIAGAVGGCQAETGTAAAMGAAAITYALGGDMDMILESVSVTIMNMLGLICDPVAGLVEIPCVKRNASASVIAFSSAQIALAGDTAGIPVDEVVDAMGEVGASMEIQYKETALGGLAATPTGQAIAERVLKNEAESIESEEETV